jgi:hypothetical protein
MAFTQDISSRTLSYQSLESEEDGLVNDCLPHIHFCLIAIARGQGDHGPSPINIAHPLLHLATQQPFWTAGSTTPASLKPGSS